MSFTPWCDYMTGTNGPTGERGAQGPPGKDGAETGIISWNECAWKDLNSGLDYGQITVRMFDGQTLVPT